MTEEIEENVLRRNAQTGGMVGLAARVILKLREIYQTDAEAVLAAEELKRMAVERGRGDAEMACRVAMARMRSHPRRG